MEEVETINEGEIFPLETDFGFPRKLKKGEENEHRI